MPNVCPIGTEIQTLIFPSAKFVTADAARVWALQHGFHARKIDEKIGKTAATFRIRQYPPTRYESKSFRTIPLGDSGVQAVIGCPKQVAMARQRRAVSRGSGGANGSGGRTDDKQLRERMKRLLGASRKK